MFLVQNVKEPIFITGHEEQKERSHSKAFEQIKTSPPTKHALVFSNEKIFLLGSDEGIKEQPLACSIPARCTDTDENQILSPYYGYFEWSLATLYFHSSS